LHARYAFARYLNLSDDLAVDSKGGEVMYRSILMLCAIMGVTPSTAGAFAFCNEPSEPSIPGGFYADKYAMERAKREVEEYLDDMREYKQCLLIAAQQADNDAESIVEEWNRAVQNYNNR
jgi:hypothetical protein